MRQQYYLDLDSCWAVQDCLAQVGPTSMLSLAGMSLAALPQASQLCGPLLGLRVLDLSGNALTGTGSLLAPAFPLLEELNLV